MQKIFLKKIKFSIITLLAIFSVLPCKAESIETKGGSSALCFSEKVSGAKILSGGELEVHGSMKCSDEVEILDDLGNKIYQKYVLLNREIKEIDKEYDTSETISNLERKLTFTYDKKSKIKMCVDSENLQKNKSHWKVFSICEKYFCDGVYMVSDKYRVYKKSIFGSYTFSGNGFADIFCTVNGDIGICSDAKKMI